MFNVQVVLVGVDLNSHLQMSGRATIVKDSSKTKWLSHSMYYISHIYNSNQRYSFQVMTKVVGHPVYIIDIAKV